MMGYVNHEVQSLIFMLWLLWMTGSILLLVLARALFGHLRDVGTVAAAGIEYEMQRQWHAKAAAILASRTEQERAERPVPLHPSQYPTMQFHGAGMAPR